MKINLNVITIIFNNKYILKNIKLINFIIYANILHRLMKCKNVSSNFNLLLFAQFNALKFFPLKFFVKVLK